MMKDTQLAAYQAAHEAAALGELTGWGWLRLTGRDRLDLLHRLSTNDLKKLAPGAGAPTVVTSAVGRVMALLTVYAGETDVYVRTMAGQGAGVSRYLNSMIFWNDQVEVANLSEASVQAALVWPTGATNSRAADEPESADTPPYGWRAERCK